MLDDIEQRAVGAGLRLRGAFHPLAADQVPGVPGRGTARTLVLLGNVGGSLWAEYRAAPEAGDGEPDPLDRWSARVIEGLATAFGALAVYPFRGPPYHPFQRWARRAEPVAPSPIGPLLHPRWGLWHAYRGALAFAERLELPPAPAPVDSLCASCADRPCLATCPVEALGDGHYEVPACARHLGSGQGDACLHGGCLARRACPVGVEWQYPPGQQSLHMQAFLDARR